MKTGQAILFFGIVFIVYGLINYYVSRRILSVVPGNLKNYVTALLVFLILSFIVGRVLENYWVSHLSDFLVWTGSFWIAIMFYTLLCLIVLDFFRIINYFIPFFPDFVKQNPDKTKRLVAIIISIFVLVSVAGGFINSRIINIKSFHINIHKKAAPLKSLNIVMASDIHLGTINGKKFAYDMVYMINKLNPDIILFAGDIIDEDIKPVLRDNVGEALLELKSKYGVYGITGNHEYIGGIKEAVDYLNNHNIKIIRDTSVLIDNAFYIVGREDRSINRFTDKGRKSLNNILAGVDHSKPIIMMDHQPYDLHEAENNGVDLQLSGHTHNGQLWPFNILINQIYELGWGLKRTGNTSYYISCGVGGWGPPVRTGSRPEIVNIKLNFID